MTSAPCSTAHSIPARKATPSALQVRAQDADGEELHLRRQIHHHAGAGRAVSEQVTGLVRHHDRLTLIQLDGHALAHATPEARVPGLHAAVDDAHGHALAGGTVEGPPTIDAVESAKSARGPRARHRGTAPTRPAAARQDRSPRVGARSALGRCLRWRETTSRISSTKSRSASDVSRSWAMRSTSLQKGASSSRSRSPRRSRHEGVDSVRARAPRSPMAESTTRSRRSESRATRDGFDGGRGLPGEDRQQVHVLEREGGLVLLVQHLQHAHHGAGIDQRDGGDAARQIAGLLGHGRGRSAGRRPHPRGRWADRWRRRSRRCRRSVPPPGPPRRHPGPRRPRGTRGAPGRSRRARWTKPRPRRAWQRRRRPTAAGRSRRRRPVAAPWPSHAHAQQHLQGRDGRSAHGRDSVVPLTARLLARAPPGSGMNKVSPSMTTSPRSASSESSLFTDWRVPPIMAARSDWV